MSSFALWMEGLMATVIAQAQKLSTFLRKLAQRVYDVRLAKAECETKRHRLFLGR
jgi:hypothetical protein